MHSALRHPARITLLLLLIITDRTQAQQNPKLTTVNYGNIVLTASTWPFLIAEQEGFFQREGIDFKRVIGGNTTATTQALVAGSTDIAQMNLVNLLAANSAGADLIVIGGDSTVPIYTLIVHSSIKSYADLKGKRLAVTGPTDPLNYILARMLAANGLAPSDYEMIGLGGAPQRLAAVQNRGVAGALINQPWISSRLRPASARSDSRPTMSTTFSIRLPARAATGRKKTAPLRCAFCALT